MAVPDSRTVRELAREQIINHAKNLAQDTETIFESVIEKDVCIPLSESEQEALADAVRAEIGRAQVTVSWPDEQPAVGQWQTREDKRGRYLDSEGIGAGAEGDQLITWGGNIDQIMACSPHGSNRVFLVLGMLGLDPYRSEETCPQVRITLTEEHARQLAACINHVLEGGIEAVGEQQGATS